MGPSVGASQESVIRVQKKHIDPPAPHDPVSRRRTSSAPPASPSHQSCRRHTLGTAPTSDRVFPSNAPAAATSTVPHIAPSILSWEGSQPVTPQRRYLRSPSSPSSCESSARDREFSLKSLTGERRHMNPPGQVSGGLFTSIFPCEKPASVERTRPILRQKYNCVSRGEGPQPKPCRLLRKCSAHSQGRGFTFIDSAVVPFPRPNP